MKIIKIIENHWKTLGINWIFKKILKTLEHYYTSKNPISARNSGKSLVSHSTNFNVSLPHTKKIIRNQLKINRNH